MDNAIGFGVLMAVVVGAALITPSSAIVPIIWPFIYAVLALMAWFFWHRYPESDNTTSWLITASVAVVLGIASLGVDILMGHSQHPELPLLEAAKTVRGPFGYAFTIVICPTLFIVAIASLARSIYRARHRHA